MWCDMGFGQVAQGKGPIEGGGLSRFSWVSPSAGGGRRRPDVPIKRPPKGPDFVEHRAPGQKEKKNATKEEVEDNGRWVSARFMGLRYRKKGQTVNGSTRRNLTVAEPNVRAEPDFRQNLFKRLIFHMLFHGTFAKQTQLSANADSWVCNSWQRLTHGVVFGTFVNSNEFRRGAQVRQKFVAWDRL